FRRAAHTSCSPAHSPRPHIGLVIVPLLAVLTLLAHATTGPSLPPHSVPPAQAATPGSSSPGAASAPSQWTPTNQDAAAVVDFPWLSTRTDGRPTTWPCQPIRYRLVRDGAPDGAQQLVAEAFSRISGVS